MKANDQERLVTDPLIPLTLRLALPTALAQAVIVLYSIVDRIFIGHIPSTGDLAIAGVGVASPITTFITSFSVLIGLGGAPIMAMKAGHGEKEGAEEVLGTALSLLLILSAILTPLFFLLRRPLLATFGSSPVTFPFAYGYLSLYLVGTPFALLSSGLNSYIINQGRSRTAMLSVLTGAALNILLDPLFIFTFSMGCEGAALATVISMAASSLIAFVSLKSRNAILTLRLTKPTSYLTRKICLFGLSPFIIISTDSILMIALNTVLQKYSLPGQGDSLITAATIIQSWHLLVMNPLGGITGGCQGMISYNYGAGISVRVKKGIVSVGSLGVLYTCVIFILVRTSGPAFISLFTDDASIADLTLRNLKVFTAMIIPLALQYSNVDCFTAMGQVRFSLPLSLLRKTLFLLVLFILPHFLGAEGAFLSEPVCDITASIVSTTIMVMKLPSILKEREEKDLRI